jgi:hypothetical protein
MSRLELGMGTLPGGVFKGVRSLEVAKPFGGNAGHPEAMI